MKRLAASLLCFFALLLPDANAGESKTLPSERCGVILPLTGKVADWGRWAREGIELATEDFKSSGVQFLFEDDQYTPAKTVSALRKLIDVDKISCLITLGSATSLAVQNIAEEAKLPMFAGAISPKIGQGMQYVFRYYLPVSRQAEALSAEVKRRAYKRLAIITAEHDATLPLSERLVQDKITEIVFDEKFSGDEHAVSPLALRIRATKPDAVFLNLIPPLPSTFARRLRDLGYRGELFGSPTLDSVDEIRAAQGALDGAWFITVDNRRAKEFNARYERTHGSMPSMVSLYAYDIAKIIITRPSSVSLPDHVRSLKKFEGAAGLGGWNGSEFEIPAGVWTIEHGAMLGPR